MKAVIATVMIFAGLALIVGFWPLALIVGGFALFAHWQFKSTVAAARRAVPPENK
jgi:hypothetical protein